MEIITLILLIATIVLLIISIVLAKMYKQVKEDYTELAIQYYTETEKTEEIIKRKY